MFTPNGTPDALGKFTLAGLRDAHANDSIYWARMQRSPTRYVDARGHVLMLGDAASGFFPTLGQGAGMAIEDASVTANVIRGALDASQARGGAVDVAACTSLIQALRYERREFVADVSQAHTAHMVTGGAEALATFEGGWLGTDGGGVREAMRRVYSDYPRAAASYAAGLGLGGVSDRAARHGEARLA